MRLPGQLLDTPPVGDTLVTVTLGNTDGVDDLVLLEHAGDADLLLEVGTGKLDLVGDGTAVDLDLHEVGLLLLEAGLGVQYFLMRSSSRVTDCPLFSACFLA
jgi:hypothetical protein